MMTRRHFAGALAAGLAAAEPPKLAVIFTGRDTPRRSPGPVTFNRAYAACPESVAMRRSILSGRFPHSAETPPIVGGVDTEAAGIPTLYVSRPADDSPFERSVRISARLRHPRLHSGETGDVPISTVDIAPTLYGLAGLAVPGQVHGTDLSEWLLTGRGKRPESLYAEGGLGTPDEWRMVLRGLDKIVVRPNLEVVHFFNLGEDPGEERDLSREIGFRLRVDEMTALVRMWMRRTEDGLDPSGLRRR